MLLNKILKYKNAVLIFFLFSCWIFSLWQLDLIRHLFIHESIITSLKYPNWSYNKIFNYVLWNTTFGFPPFSWFNITFSLQTSFDLMYFLQFFVIFFIFYILFKDRILKVGINRETLIGTASIFFGLGIIIHDFILECQKISNPYRLHGFWIGIILVILGWILLNRSIILLFERYLK